MTSGETLADKSVILLHLFANSLYLLTVLPGLGLNNRSYRFTLPVRDLRIGLNGVKYYCRKGTDDFLILTSVYEREPLEMASHIEDATFVDVGAHIGKYSLPVARNPSNRVIAIEPNEESYRILVKNIRLNGFKNVIPMHCAASSRDGRIRFYEVSGFTGWSSTGHHDSYDSYDRDTYKVETVRARRLDSILQGLNVKNVDLVKIDVEGMESEVFKGMTNTMRSNKPKIVFESWERPVENSKFLRRFGYSVRKVSEIMWLASNRSCRT